jgi:hypothetical protein
MTIQVSAKMSSQKINLVDSAMTHDSQGVRDLIKSGVKNNVSPRCDGDLFHFVREVSHIFQKNSISRLYISDDAR